MRGRFLRCGFFPGAAGFPAGFGLHALRQFPAPGLAIPLFEGLVRDLALHQQFGEFAPLGLALERHRSMVDESASACEAADEDSKDSPCGSQGEGKRKGQDRKTEHLIHKNAPAVGIGHPGRKLESA